MQKEVKFERQVSSIEEATQKGGVRTGVAWLAWPWSELCTHRVRLHEAQQSLAPVRQGSKWSFQSLLCAGVEGGKQEGGEGK